MLCAKDILYNLEVNKLYIKAPPHFKFNYQSLFEHIIKLTCEQENLQGPTEVNLIIVSNLEMLRLAHQYHKQNKVTDILAFPANYKSLVPFLNYNMLGDMYIAYQKIITQAQAYHHSLTREWAYIFTHGLYHLLGYEHSNSMADEIMRGKVKKIMTQIKVGRND